MTIRRMLDTKGYKHTQRYVILLIHRSSGFANAPHLTSYAHSAYCLMLNLGGTCIIAIHAAVTGSVRRCEAVWLVRLLMGGGRN